MDQLKIQEIDERKKIKDIECAIDKINNLRIKWKWPDLSSGINYAYLYSVHSKDESLDEAINRNADCAAIPRSSGDYFEERLTEASKMYRIYPAIFDGNSTTIFNQSTDNASILFFKRTILKWKVKYDPFVFSSPYKIASIKIENLEKLADIPWENALLYRIYRKVNNQNHKLIANYPFNFDMLQDEHHCILVEKDCEIDLACHEDYAGAVVLEKQ